MRRAVEEAHEGFGVEVEIVVLHLIAHIDGTKHVVEGVRAVHQHVQIEQFKRFFVPYQVVYLLI